MVGVGQSDGGREGRGATEGGRVMELTHLGSSSSLVAVVMGGSGHQQGAVSSSMGGCSCLWALDVCGWVVVVRGHWMFMGGGSWSLTVERHLWALKICGRASSMGP